MNIQASFLTLADSVEYITYMEADGGICEETYASLFKNAMQMLGGLQARGLEKGTPVMLQLASIKTTITAFWACAMGGLVPAILPLARNEKSHSFLNAVYESLDAPVILSDLEGMTALFHDNLLMARALTSDSPGVHLPCDDEDPAMIQFTSGTTSEPKGAVLTMSNLWEGGLASSIIVREGVTERYLSWLPLSHCFGFVGYHLVPIFNNFPQFLISPQCFIKDPACWVRLLSDYRATVTGLPLFAVDMLLKMTLPKCDSDRSYDLSSMYICFCGGEDVNPQSLIALEEKLKPLGWVPDTLKPAYGLSETTMGVAYTPYGSPLRVDHFLSANIGIGNKLYFCDPDERTLHRVSVGVLDKCNEVVIKDESGTILDEDYLGLIHIRGTNVMKGYYTKYPDAPTGVDSEGWFNTGDLGFFHKGWLNIFGRYKNIIIVNGENYLVTDLEKTGIQALDKPNPLFIVQGRPKDGKDAMLVLFGAGVSREDLERAGRAIASVWKLPVTRGAIIDAIPQTTSGKTNRMALTVGWEQGLYKQAAFNMTGAGDTQLEGDQLILARLWARVLDASVNSIAPYSHFIFDLNGDSLAVMDLIWQIEKELGVVITANELQETLTLEEMTQVVFK